MGTPIIKEDFEEEDYRAFKQCCASQVQALRKVLAHPNFSQGEQTFGCEVEFSLIKANGSPALINIPLIEKMGNDEWQTELNQYNLEYNLQHYAIAGKPFSQLEQSIQSCYQIVNTAASHFDAQAMMVGILPTISKRDITLNNMTPQARYRALAKGIKSLKKGPFEINIDGIEPLKLKVPDLTLEGANTSIQLHLKVKASDFVDWYNAIQLATPLAVAVSGNSPIFLEHQLWDETRIAVFKQALESRKDKENIGWRQPHRVSYGYGWLREEAWEYFAEIQSMYPPLLPILTEKSLEEQDSFNELQMHLGTVWRWNRGIYDPINNGHVRIEMRALPAGPSIPDMVASSAFLIGLAAYLKTQIKTTLPAFPFMFTEYNFYRAAQSGLDAKLLWPDMQNLSPQEYSVGELVNRYLPLALEGLQSLDVDLAEGQQWLSLVKERLDRGITGARWMRAYLKKFDSVDRKNTLSQLTLKYLSNMQSHQSVVQW